MTYSIIWSPLAESTYFKILDYLLEHWTEREALKFQSRLEEVLGYLQESPHMYVYSREMKSYRAVLSPQTTLVYRLKDESVIELITFWDTRQDPEKLSL